MIPIAGDPDTLIELKIVHKISANERKRLSNCIAEHRIKIGNAGMTFDYEAEWMGKWDEL
ncbi:MAG: hypothetical protein R2849_11115 [Thermomicrobiales bacterium]